MEYRLTHSTREANPGSNSPFFELNSHLSTVQPSGRFYNTNDLARYLPSGEIELIGRQDRQVKIMGKARYAHLSLLDLIVLLGIRTELGEIEAVIEKLAFVKQAFVYYDEGKLTCAIFQTFRRPATHDWNLSFLVKTWSARHLPYHMRPISVAMLHLDALPLTPNGKIDRLAIKKMTTEAAQTTYCTSPASACTQTELYVANIMLRALEFPEGEVGPETNFFEIGGDSLLALKFVRILKLAVSHGSLQDEESRLGIITGALAPMELMKRPVLRDYCKFLESDADFCSHVNRITGTENVAIGKASEDSATEDTSIDAALIRLLTTFAGLGDLEMVSAVLDLGADVNGGVKKSKPGVTPLHVAVINNYDDVAGLLLDRGANPMCITPTHVTVAFHAAQRQDSHLLARLLDAGAILRTCDNRKQSLMHSAARSGSVACVVELVRRGLDVDLRDHWHRPPLVWAVINGHVMCVKALLENGATASGPPLPLTKLHKSTHVKFLSPLHFAIRHADGSVALQMVELLLDHKANPSRLDDDGDAPIHTAAKMLLSDRSTARETVFRLLIAHGADPTRPNTQGLAPHDMLEAQGLNELFAERVRLDRQ